MFRGFATIGFYADDVAAARRWYAELFGLEAYFAVPSAEEPAYVEFRIGDDADEFGIIDRRYAPPGASDTPGGALMHWHVDDLHATLRTLLAMGATEWEPVTEHRDEQGESSGFVTASVVDPFGNVLGIMNNPHYLEMLATRVPA